MVNLKGLVTVKINSTFSSNNKFIFSKWILLFQPSFHNHSLFNLPSHYIRTRWFSEPHDQYITVRHHPLRKVQVWNPTTSIWYAYYTFGLLRPYRPKRIKTTKLEESSSSLLAQDSGEVQRPLDQFLYYMGKMTVRLYQDWHKSFSQTFQ